MKNIETEIEKNEESLKINNAKIIKDILSGKKGPKRDVVLMNASIALIAAGKAKSLKEGVSIAARSIDSGKAKEKLKSLAGLTNK